MTPEEAAMIIGRLGLWSEMRREQTVLWHEHLARMEYHRSVEAVRRLERTEDRRPSLAKFIETYESLQRRFPPRMIERPVCAICNDGWVEQHDGAFTRCPNGCLPLTADERAERDRIEADAWSARPPMRVQNPLAAAKAVLQDRSQVVTARVLDERVPNWRERITAAVQEDARTGRWRERFDEVRAEFRAELAGGRRAEAEEVF